MLEKDLLREARDWLRLVYSTEVKAVKIHGSPYTENGIPDLLICLRGRFIAAEAKQPGKKPTTIQERRLQEYRDAGGTAFWFDTMEEFKTEMHHAAKPPL